MNAFVENFPDDSELVMSNRPCGFLRSDFRAPISEPPRRLAPFCCNGCPGGLRKCAPHHPVALSRAATHADSRTFLLTRTDSHPGCQFARRSKSFRTGTDFCNDLLGGSHANPGYLA